MPCLNIIVSAKTSFRTGTVIRSRPLAQNLGGIYDQYRRPKLAVSVVADKFAKIK